MRIDVEHVAKLARLHIPQQELACMAAQMQQIVQMVENLPPLEGGALLEPENTMALRDDEARESFPREAILSNAPQTAQGCFLVPKTVE